MMLVTITLYYKINIRVSVRIYVVVRVTQKCGQMKNKQREGWLLLETTLKQSSLICVFAKRGWIGIRRLYSGTLEARLQEKD